MTTEEFSYDTLPYPSLIFPQTHPNRLAAMGKFYGLETASPDKCRVLELGCGDGTNLNWLAYSLPDSEFVGVDLAKTHIADANRAVSEIGLENIKFFQQDVMEMSVENFGKFDYIIAHGLFSWVPDFVREKILSLYRNLLNSNGIGYISYNAFPGCYRRKMAGDLLRFYTNKFENPVEKIERGVSFLNFITEKTIANPIYHQILKYELEQMVKRSHSNIYHDDLSEENQPFYFTEFIEKAAKHDLQFLSEVDTFPTQPRKIPEEISQAFGNISENIIEYEQYIDFFENARFRLTLLCQKEVSLDRKFESDKIKQFLISSNLNPTGEITNLASSKSEKFVSLKGEIAETNHVLTKAALFYLHTIGTHAVPFDELIAKSRELLENEGFTSDDWESEIEAVTALLFQLYSPDSILFHLIKLRAVNSIGEKPQASDFARWQVTKSLTIVTFSGLQLEIQDEFIKELLLLLDGTRTREELLDTLVNKLYLEAQNVDKQEFIEQIAIRLDKYLEQMARVGLLI